MKRLVLILISIPCLILGCSNQTTEPIKDKDTITEIAIGKNIFPKISQDKHNTKYDYYYSFSTDSVCETLQIKILNRSKKYDGIPQKIAFILVLKNKVKNITTSINGIAFLTSPNESFLDEKELDSGAYFAADYNRNNTSYSINIKLDIERYEACAISLKSDAKNNLDIYTKYLKEYPNYNILKRYSPNTK